MRCIPGEHGNKEVNGKKNISAFEASKTFIGRYQDENIEKKWRNQEKERRMEDNWIKVQPRNNKKEIYAEKVYKGNSVRVVKVSEKRREEKYRYRETDTRRRKN